MYRYLLNNANFISIHAPRGGSDLVKLYPVHMIFLISIHAPRGGSDDKDARENFQKATFQSTLPAGGATYVDEVLPGDTFISIHAPRGGSDPRKCRP